MYTKEAILEAAERAADALEAALLTNPDLDIVYTEQLIEWSGLTPPADTDTIAVGKGWQVNLMILRTLWRNDVFSRTGRWPETRHGSGFKLLTPAGNVRHVDLKVLADISKTVGHGRKILRGTSTTALTDEQKRRKQSAETRMSALASNVRKARIEANRMQQFRNAPVNTKQNP